MVFFLLIAVLKNVDEFLNTLLDIISDLSGGLEALSLISLDVERITKLPTKRQHQARKDRTLLGGG